MTTLDASAQRELGLDALRTWLIPHSAGGDSALPVYKRTMFDLVVEELLVSARIDALHALQRDCGIDFEPLRVGSNTRTSALFNVRAKVLACIMQWDSLHALSLLEASFRTLLQHNTELHARLLTQAVVDALLSRSAHRWAHVTSLLTNDFVALLDSSSPTPSSDTLHLFESACLLLAFQDHAEAEAQAQAEAERADADTRSHAVHTAAGPGTRTGTGTSTGAARSRFDSMGSGMSADSNGSAPAAARDDNDRTRLRALSASSALSSSSAGAPASTGGAQPRPSRPPPPPLGGSPAIGGAASRTVAAPDAPATQVTHATPPSAASSGRSARSASPLLVPAARNGSGSSSILPPDVVRLFSAAFREETFDACNRAMLAACGLPRSSRLTRIVQLLRERQQVQAAIASESSAGAPPGVRGVGGARGGASRSASSPAARRRLSVLAESAGGGASHGGTAATVAALAGREHAVTAAATPGGGSSASTLPARSPLSYSAAVRQGNGTAPHSPGAALLRSIMTAAASPVVSVSAGSGTHARARSRTSDAAAALLATYHGATAPVVPSSPLRLTPNSTARTPGAP